MSEGAEHRGTEPIEERPGTGSEGGEGEANTSATPRISDEDQEEGQTQVPAESDDAGTGQSGTEDPRP